LKKNRLNLKGELLIPSEKKRVAVELTEKDEEKLEEDITKIKEILEMKTPPQVVKIPFCRHCAYREFCWA
jgi:CRISPR-associated exonuclease Cas4